MPISDVRAMFPYDTKILLAEDTDVTRAIIHKMIYKLGYTNVVQVADGVSAKRELEKATVLKKPFNLIISDWNMPEYSGMALLKFVRSDAQMSQTPFLILTSNNEKEQVMEAIRTGVTAYVTKPFSIEVLEKKLKEAWSVIQKKKAS